MKRIVKKLVPQVLKNYGKHWPEAIVANLRYGFPSRKVKVIGVTGTDGKTTTVNMIYHILKSAGENVSMVSTINAVIAGESVDTGFHVTSPSAFSLQKYIFKAKKAGTKYLILEVTSHALDQFRVLGIKFDVAVITNVTHEHLDYHKTFEKYLKTKAKLIRNAKVAVLNKEDSNFKKLSKLTHGKVVSFGIKRDADINIHNTPIKLKIAGDYNRLNALAASAVCLNLGIARTTILSSLAKFETLSGRMEEVKNSRGIKIIVDFAHTPNALEQSLESLRKQTSGKLISVFGAASERDIKKRPLMGAISAKLANITVLTSEDPRFEDPEKIIDEIERAAITHGAKPATTLFREADRAKAIELALSLAKRGDVIGIFGKGHEQSMNIRGKETHWSDKEAVEKALK